MATQTNLGCYYGLTSRERFAELIKDAPKYSFALRNADANTLRMFSCPSVYTLTLVGLAKFVVSDFGDCLVIDFGSWNKTWANSQFFPDHIAKKMSERMEEMLVKDTGLAIECFKFEKGKDHLAQIIETFVSCGFTPFITKPIEFVYF